MAYLGHKPAVGENNSFRILDDISSFVLTFDGSSASVVGLSDETITITENNHRFITGQRVTYSNGGGGNITGLTNGQAYFVINHSKTQIKLASSASNALAGTAVNLTGLGTGSSHTLTLAFDGVNTKFVPTFGDGMHDTLIKRAAQLVISLNGVIQQPHDTATPSTGFGVDSLGNLIFSTAPASTDAFWAHVLATNTVTFDSSDNDVDTFTGNGSTTSFTLSKIPPDNRNILVTIDGVVQYPSDAATTRSYNLSENVMTFVAAPGNGTSIQVRHIGYAGPAAGGGGGVTGFYGRTGNVSLIATDNIVANDATFSGNVSIAQTLTYEDVTDIDSVGLITARSGIKADGDINFPTSMDSTESGGVAVQRFWSTGTITAGSAYKCGKWEEGEGALQLLINVRSETGGHSGTATYLWQGGYLPIGGTGYSRLFPLASGNGHGDGSDNGLNTGGWGVLVHQSGSYGFEIWVYVPSSKSNKALKVAITELNRGNNFTDLSASASMPSVNAGYKSSIKNTAIEKLYFKDNHYAYFGDSQDLQLWHNGSHSYIKDNGTGRLIIQSSQLCLQDTSGNNHIVNNPGGSVQIYHDFANNTTAKIVTNSTGAQINTVLLLYGAAGNPGRLRLQEGGALSEIIGTRNSDLNSDLQFKTERADGTQVRAKIDYSGHFIPGADSTHDLGLTGTRWRNLYADTLYGDGSNLTGIASDKIFELNTEVETVDTGSNGHVKITTDGDERLRITHEGKVGIGTDTPSSKFHIHHPSTSATQILECSNGSVELALKHTNGYGSVNTYYQGTATWRIGQTGQFNDFSVWQASGVASGEDAYRFAIKNSGNVGVSTHTPRQIFHVNKNSGTACILVSSSTAPQIRFNPNATDTTDGDRTIFGQATGNSQFVNSAVSGDTVLRGTSSGSVKFGIGNDEKVRITNSGNLEIINNNDYLKIGAGGALSMVFTGGQSYITNSTGHLTGRSASYTWENLAGSAEYVRIDSSGRVLIGSIAKAGDSALQVYTSDKLHPAIRTNSASNNGYTMFSDAYKAGESQVNMGIAYSSASLVLSQGCKVNTSNDDAYVSSQGTYNTRPNVIRLDTDGSFSYHSRESSATTPTDNAVTLTELFKIDRVGNMYQRISARNMYFGASNQLRIGVQSNGDPNIEAVSGNLKIMDGGNTIMYVRDDGFEMAQGIYPLNDDSKDLGKSTKRWANIYTTDLHLSNEGKSNVVDGTWGDWTLQEGEHKIYMINNRTGKKYSLKMEEE